jgi:dTDP-4-dehydrorhamnose 3,5-epimerase
VSGAIFDVAVDLRPGSRTYCRWYGTELSAANRRMLFVPVGLAHGFQTLLAESEVLYQMGHAYVPQAARGVRWDDPAFAIEWPAPASGSRTMSDGDATYPDFEP